MGRARGEQRARLAEEIRGLGIAHKNAGIIRRVAVQHGAAEIDVGSTSELNRSEDVMFSGRNDHSSRLRCLLVFARDEACRNGSFLNAARSAAYGIAGSVRLPATNSIVPGLPSPLHVPPVTCTAS